MNRRSIIIYTAVAVLLLAGVACLFSALFFADREGQAGTDRLAEGVQAVPSDAIFLFETGSFSEIRDMTDGGSALGMMLACFPTVSSEWPAVVSMHYSSKNTVSPLVVLSLPDDGAAGFVSDLLAGCDGVVEKRYGESVIYKSAVPDASFARVGGFFVASPSLVIVESSLRHLETGESVMTDPMYSRIGGVSSDDGILHVSSSNLGKIFSGMAAGAYVRYASFFQSFADWFTLGLEGDGSTRMLEGKCAALIDGEKYSDVLMTQRGAKPEVFSVAPHDAAYIITLPLSSLPDYMSAYGTYLSARGLKTVYNQRNKKLAEDRDMSVADFVSSLELTEAAVFATGADGSDKILALRAGNTDILSDCRDTVGVYGYAGYVPQYLGGVFRPSSEDSCCVTDGWVLVGPGHVLESMLRQRQLGTYFSFKDFLEQTPAAEELREISCLSVVVNPSLYAGTLSSFFKEPYSKTVRGLFGRRNFEYLFLNTYRTGDELGLRLSSYSEDLSSMPQPELPEGVQVNYVDEETPVVIPEGPYPVTNFIDGSRNWLEQLDNCNLRLLGRSRNPVWTVKFDKKICGTVRQIDYLKNNKLQMLFGAGDRIYLLDRLGRMVGKFPYSLGREILLGPDVYDFNGDKNYSLMVLHTDNTLAMYDVHGDRLEGWSDISPAERILSLPEEVMVGGARYWVVRTPYQTLIYDGNGTICAEFAGKHKLKKDTSVEPVSSYEAAVTAQDGREYILDLRDGSFRRR
ncbi:MAG TPA: hypothetical protein IAC03_06100 [Candidatus Coprenecus pullistercoris]|nr:hypothetical protein [Candidatus Coprenecus pullistercoris]